MVVYNHDSNAILSKPPTLRNEHKLIRAIRVLHTYLSDRGLTPQYQILDNECPGGLKTFLREASVKFQLVTPYLHLTTPQNVQSKLTRITSSPARESTTQTYLCIYGTVSYHMPP